MTPIHIGTYIPYLCIREHDIATAKLTVEKSIPWEWNLSKYVMNFEISSRDRYDQIIFKIAVIIAAKGMY